MKKIKFKLNLKEPDDKHDPVDDFAINYWKTTTAYNKILTKESQYDYYKKNGSCEDMLKLIRLESKSFGSVIESIIKELFKMENRTSSQNDCVLNGKKIEIKSARYWGCKDACKWQHIEPNHDYDIVMFVLVDFNSLKIWCIKKDYLMVDLKNKNIIKQQGKQGMWVSKSDILPYMSSIKSIKDMLSYLDNI